MKISKLNFLIFFSIALSFCDPLWAADMDGVLVGVLFYSALGCFLGFLLGQFVDHKFGTSIGFDSRRFLLWLTLILIGTAIGVLVAKRSEKG